MKMPMSQKLELAKIAASIQLYPTIVDLSNWINEYVQYKIWNIKNNVVTNYWIITRNKHIFECSRFLKASVNDRWSQVKKIRDCFSCLNVGHRTHHKLLHETAHCKIRKDSTPLATSESQQVLNCASANNNKEKLLFRVVPLNYLEIIGSRKYMLWLTMGLPSQCWINQLQTNSVMWKKKQVRCSMVWGSFGTKTSNIIQYSRKRNGKKETYFA